MIRERWRSIRTAWQGVRYVLQTQQNARIHLLIALLVLIVAALFRVSRVEWILLLVMISIVWAAELFNTAVEVIIDHISPEQQRFARISKDVSAAGVLITAIISILVGGLIFGPRLVSWWASIIGK